MLKRKIDKATYDALSADLKAVYKEVNGEYLLQADDAAELLAAKQRETERAQEAEAEAQRLRDEKKAADDAVAAAAEKAKLDKAKADGDMSALEQSYQQKLADQKKEQDAENKRLRGLLESVTVDAQAATLAAEISTVPELMQPLIRKRLQSDFSGDTVIVRVLDAEGKPSAANIDNLKQEFVANPKFASIIKASNASGGSANGNNSGGSATKKISDMNESERTALHKEIGADAFRARQQAEGGRVFGQ